MNTNKLSKTNSPFRSSVLFWFLTFLWVVIICYLSLSDSGLPEIKFRFIIESDKIAHSFSYFVLMVLLSRSWLSVFSVNVLNNILLLSFIQVISFSIILEYLQKIITSTRQFDLHDIYANIAGTVIGVIFYLVSYRFFKNTSSKANKN